MKWVIDNKYEGLLIRDYLKRVHHFSNSLLKTIKFDGGRIAVNKVEQTVRYQLSEHDVLTVEFPPEKKSPFMKPEDLPLEVVYEDSDIMIINKQASQATMPSPIHPTGTLANSVLGHYEKHNIPYAVHVVTRLDRDTSGLLLIAKHRYSHSLLALEQSKGTIKRKYKAIVEGILSNKNSLIDAPIGRKEGSIIERQVIKSGQKAITHYQVEKEANNHSLVDVELQTGRTHQIRVHFSSINHPLAGDDLYGGSKTFIKRQALHCYEIEFIHPLTKEAISFQLDMPDDMSAVIR